jgi:hypothetical protein
MQVIKLSIVINRRNNLSQERKNNLNHINEILFYILIKLLLY